MGMTATFVCAPSQDRLDWRQRKELLHGHIRQIAQEIESHPREASLDKRWSDHGAYFDCPFLHPVRYRPTTRLGIYSVKLDNPVFATRNDYGTVIVDTGKTRLVFVDSKNELTKIVQVDEGELPINEVSRVQLASEGVIVIGSKCTDDGETLASESVLYFSYDGTYMQPLWNATP